VEVFYALLPAGRGYGSATRAAALLARWATHAGATQVVLVTFAENTASQRTAQRADFEQVGRERRQVKDTTTDLLLWRWARTATDQEPGHRGRRPLRPG
jgi:RimJ/RimL family protein N-acetyltransferase